MSDYLDPENEELLKDFFIEAESQVTIMESSILIIEGNPQDQDSVDELFRAAHTLKGGAATVQMQELAEFAHRVEDLLDEIRSGAVKITSSMVDVLLDSIDLVKDILQARMDGSIYPGDISEIQEKLVRFANPDNTPVDSAEDSEYSLETAAKIDKNKLPEKLSQSEYIELENFAVGETIYRMRVHFDETNPMNTIGSIQAYTRIRERSNILNTKPAFDDLYGDMFYEYVDFYITLNDSPEIVLEKSLIPDVSLDIDLVEFDLSMVQNEDLISQGLPVAERIDSKAIGEEAGSKGLAAPSPAQKEPVKDRIDSAKKAMFTKKKKYKDSTGSMLRVESKRVDNILNLVSEAVINRATLNQLSSQLADMMNLLRRANNKIHNGVSQLVEKLPELAIQIANAKHTSPVSTREILKELQNEAQDIYEHFEPLENFLKEISSQFNNTASSLGRNTGDLHSAILGMRMVPIEQTFSRFARLVRDLARNLDKKVTLQLEGEETELDKSVIEELLDPLMHFVRNSMDHGIESVATRIENGKAKEGKITMRALNEGNMVIIEVADDGAGINMNRVREKAIENGIITAGKYLSDQEAFNLIFEPGFSTAQSITSVSGRGVGLDVVKKQIEKLNGSISVWSVLGEGSKFTIKLPLTLAIIKGLLVRVGEEVYAIPITSVAESLRITEKTIKHIDNYEVINVRDDVISLLRLNRLFQIKPKKSDAAAGYMFVVVVGTEERRIGLMVDSLIGEEDVVIKPLVDRYTNSLGIAGATILGDGTVSLILDVSQLLELGVEFERLMRNNRFIGMGSKEA